MNELIPAGGHESNEAYSASKHAIQGAGENVQESKAAVTKATSAVKDLVSGKGNMVDAAMAVKGAYDNVTGLTGRLSATAMMPVMKALSAFKGQAIMPAGKQMDPVLGIDVHMVTIPPSPAPVPMPHPYIGILFNTKDWVSCLINTFKTAALNVLPEPAEEDHSNMASIAKNKDAIASIAMGLAGMSASVKFGGFVPRAVTGTPVKSIPHIPMGAGFHPAFVASVAKNDGKAFLGSLFVAADGDPMVGSFHLNYDCWDVGIVDLFKGQRAGAKNGAAAGGALAELFVPSGTVLPIPWGKPVLVNSIPTPINPMAILDRVFKAGLGKLKKAGRALAQKGLNKLNGKVGCGALTAASKLIGTGQSHPVDVASGSFYTDQVDFELPGPIPLVWERTWYSYSSYKGPLGHGWHHRYDIALAIDADAQQAIVRMGDGRVAHFQIPAVGEELYNRLEKLSLHLHADGYYYLTDINGLLYRFTEHAVANPFNGTTTCLLQSIANRNGFAIRFTYTDRGILQQVIDSAGRILKINSDEKGCITSIEAPWPDPGVKESFTISRYQYTQEGDLEAHSNALDQSIGYAYANHLMLKEVWRNGCHWNFRYDKAAGTDAKCIEVWGSGDLLHYTFDYTDPGCTVATDSLGCRKSFYHRNGLVTEFVDAKGGHWEYRYNRFNELEWKTDPLGNQQSSTYDRWGNMSFVTEANGSFSQVNYGSGILRHSRIHAIDRAGEKWAWEYDCAGNLLRKINPLGAETKYSYSDGLVSAITNEQGCTTLLEYDADYNPVKEIYAADVAQLTIYDRLGRPTKIIDPAGNIRITKYNLLGQAVQVIEPDGNTRDLQYDAESNIIRETDQLRDIRFSYSFFNQLQIRTESGSAIRFGYDTECRLRTVVNEHNEIYRLDNDATGKVIRETGFDGVESNYTRDLAGRITRIDKPGKTSKQFCYDESGNIVRVSYQDGTFQTYSYTRDGLLTRAANGHSSIQLERGSLGRITKETTEAGSLHFEYDVAGNRTKVMSSLGAEIYNAFDLAGNLVSTVANDWSASIGYNDRGLEIERFLPGGVQHQWERDRLGRPMRQIVRSRTEYLHSRQYIWHAGHRLKRSEDSITGTSHFIHDKEGNLVQTIYGDGSSQYRKTDATGNLFSTPDRSDRTFGKAGRLIRSNGCGYKYDEEGNLVEKTTAKGHKWEYMWDAQGLLARVIRPDKEAVSFTYDALGRRLSKRYKNTVTKWLWNGNKPLHEWKEHAVTGAILSDTLVVEDGIITWIFNENNFIPAGKLKGKKNYSIVSDHVGMPFQMYDETGSKIWESQPDSYGKLKMYRGEKTSCPFRYQGQYEDAETGLYYNRFRYYDCEDGVYLKQDPIGLLGGIRPYGYVKDPTSEADLFGLTGTTTCTVYHLYDLDENGEPKGKPYYVGITDDGRTRTRQGEHEKSGRLTNDGTTGMVVQRTGLTPEQARGVEQAHIDHYQTQTGVRKGTVMDDGTVHDGSTGQDNRGNKNNSFVENDTRDPKRQDEMVKSRDEESKKLKDNE